MMVRAPSSMLSFVPDDRKHSQLLTQGVWGSRPSLLRCHYFPASGLCVSPPPPSPSTTDLSGNSDLQQEGTFLAQGRLTTASPLTPNRDLGSYISYHLQLRSPIDREHTTVNAKVRGQSLGSKKNQSNNTAGALCQSRHHQVTGR